VAIAWLLARSPVIVPIPGTSSVAHLDENVAAARVLLSTEDLHELSWNGCFWQRGCRSHWFISAGKHGSEDASRSGTKAVPPTSGADHPIVVSQTMWSTNRFLAKGESRNGADRSGERHAPARGRARFSRANRVERREFFEVPYMSHRERTAWLGM